MKKTDFKVGKDRIRYVFTQDQLEGFICFALVDSIEHPNSTPKATIKRLYKKFAKPSQKTGNSEEKK